MNKDDVYWDRYGTEILTHTDRDEAIEYILDSEPNPLPKEIEVCKFVREEVGIEDVDPEGLLDMAIERLDENYSDPDGHHMGEVTDKMKEAARRFAEVVTQEYVPWQCKMVSKEVVDTKKWITENAPSWLSEVKFKE